MGRGLVIPTATAILALIVGSCSSTSTNEPGSGGTGGATVSGGGVWTGGVSGMAGAATGGTTATGGAGGGGYLGAPCSSSSTCTSGFCIDDVCCNTACTGLCEAC